jgi:hypothetical protein
MPCSTTDWCSGFYVAGRRDLLKGRGGIDADDWNFCDARSQFSLDVHDGGKHPQTKCT